MKKALLAGALLALAACDGPDRFGPVEHETKSIDLDKSEMARVELKMGAGELRVEGGSPKLMEADFSYNILAWKPTVTYDSSSFRSRLTIEQPSGASGGPHSTYKWDLRLNNDLPIDLVANLGAGEARLNIGTLSLRTLEVNMGVGNLNMDLRGSPKRDYDVQIHGGVGNATVNLPKDVAVVANAAGGIGNITASGLEKRNGNWINPAHEHAPVTIRLDVRGGVGNITLLAQ